MSVYDLGLAREAKVYIIEKPTDPDKCSDEPARVIDIVRETLPNDPLLFARVKGYWGNHFKED